MTIGELAELHELPPTVSVEEAGQLLGISRRSAYRAVNRGEIPVLRLGRRMLVPSAKLLAMLGIAAERHGQNGSASSS